MPTGGHDVIDHCGTKLAVSRQDPNAASIPNYGERYRAGEAISSAPAESIVNTMIARRMTKRQQMRWTPAGAHRVLQIRARVLAREEHRCGK